MLHCDRRAPSLCWISYSVWQSRRLPNASGKCQGPVGVLHAAEGVSTRVSRVVLKQARDQVASQCNDQGGWMVAEAERGGVSSELEGLCTAPRRSTSAESPHQTASQHLVSAEVALNHAESGLNQQPYPVINHREAQLSQLKITNFCRPSWKRFMSLRVLVLEESW